MRVKIITDTESQDFENKINKAIEEIEEKGTVKVISASVGQHNKMRGEKVIGVEKIFFSMISYEE